MCKVLGFGSRLHDIYITESSFAFVIKFNKGATSTSNDMHKTLQKPGLWHLCLVVNDGDSIGMLKNETKCVLAKTRAVVSRNVTFGINSIFIWRRVCE